MKRNKSLFPNVLFPEMNTGRYDKETSENMGYVRGDYCYCSFALLVVYGRDAGRNSCSFLFFSVLTGAWKADKETVNLFVFFLDANMRLYNRY